MMRKLENGELGTLPFERLYVGGYDPWPRRHTRTVLRLAAYSRRSDAAALFRRIKLGPGC